MKALRLRGGTNGESIEESELGGVGTPPKGFPESSERKGRGTVGREGNGFIFLRGSHDLGSS